MKRSAVYRRPAPFAAIAAAAAGLGICPSTASAGAVLPERGGSPNADEIAFLYGVVLAIAAVIFCAVTIALVIALIRYGERRSPVAIQTRGHTRLEIAWTAAAALLIVAIAVFSLTRFDTIENPPPARADLSSEAAGADTRDHAIRIGVSGQQYIWRYTYPNGAFSYYEMVAPVGVTVKLDITSVDVAHSWWIPKLGGKFDAIPGYVSRTWFRVKRPGVYRGQCAELCGRDHATMLAVVRGVPPREYREWIARQKRLIDRANSQAARDRVARDARPAS